MCETRGAGAVGGGGGGGAGLTPVPMLSSTGLRLPAEPVPPGTDKPDGISGAAATSPLSGTGISRGIIDGAVSGDDAGLFTARCQCPDGGGGGPGGTEGATIRAISNNLGNPCV